MADGEGAAAGIVLDETRSEFRRLKDQADRALAQIGDEAFFAALDPDANSMAVLVKHLGSNLRSRWTDFLETDGEKPDRDRDGEFVIGPDDTRASLMARWESGWAALFATLEALGPGDLSRIIRIRAEPHTVAKALIRGLAHAAIHAGQIVMLAKHARGADWTTLSIPRGQSEAFNRTLRERFAGRPD